MFEFEFASTVTRWQGAAAWHFNTLPPELAEDIRRFCGDLAAGWGSIRVDARIGETQWSTSIFPDKASSSYLLPVKAAVRRAEGIGEGDDVDVLLRV